MIKDAIEDVDRTESSLDLYLDGWRCLEERKGGVMSEQKDELTAAYLAGCYDTRKAYERRLTEAEAKIPDKPLGVFSEGVWVFATTAQTFTAEDLDIAAFVKYRDYMKGGE